MNMVSVNRNMSADDCQSNGSIGSRPTTAHMFDTNSIIPSMYYNNNHTQSPVVDHPMMRIAVSDQCVSLPTTTANLNNKHLLSNTTFDPSFLNPMKKRKLNELILNELCSNNHQMRRQLSANNNGSNLGSIALLLKNLSVLQQKMKTTKKITVPTIDHTMNRTTAATQLLLSSIVANSHSKSLQFSHLFSTADHETNGDPSIIHLNSSSITSSKSSSTIASVNSPTIASQELMSAMRNTSNDHMFSLSSMPKFDIDPHSGQKPKMEESANAIEITEDTQKHTKYKNTESDECKSDILSLFDMELLIMEKERLQERKKHLQTLLLENNAKVNNIQSKAEDIDEQWKLFQKCSERRMHCQQNRTYSMDAHPFSENMTHVPMPDMSPMDHFNTVADAHLYPMADEKKKNMKVEIETQKRIICVLAVMQTAFAMFDKPKLLYKQLQNKACFYNKRIFAESPSMSMSVTKDIHVERDECRLKIKVSTEDASAHSELEMDLSTNIIGQQTYDQRREIIRQSLSTFTLTSKSHQELISKFISKNPNLKFDACNHIIFPALIKICKSLYSVILYKVNGLPNSL